MKKENKKLAQQRRAQERKKKEQLQKIKKICMIGIPVLLIVIAIVASVWPTGSSGSSTSSDTDVSSGDQSTTPDYLTDTSLTVADGDTVNIDYVGYVDGVAFDGGNTNGNGTSLTIGSGSYIDDFEEQLIGAHPGDTVEVNVTFPDNYTEELAGKDAMFEVVINGIYE